MPEGEEEPARNRFHKAFKLFQATLAFLTCPLVRGAIQSWGHLLVVNFANGWRGEVLKVIIENERIGIKAIQSSVEVKFRPTTWRGDLLVVTPCLNTPQCSMVHLDNGTGDKGR